MASDVPAEVEQLRLSGAVTVIERCDAAEFSHIRRVVARTQAPLVAVWHAAGVLADGVLPKLVGRSVRLVHAPKAYGAWALQVATSGMPLRSFTFFSSVAAC